MRKKGLIAIFTMLFLLLHTFSLAGDEPNQTALRGLKGVYVLVESLAPEAEQLGLNKGQLKTDVELRLRKAGVRVLTKEEWKRIPGVPYLYVNVNTFIRAGSALCAYSTSVVLNEMVMLARGFPTVGAIWSTGAVGSVGT